MPFHTYTRPANYVNVTTLSRSGLVFDSTLTSGNVRLYFAYDGGPIQESFNRVDGIVNPALFPEVAPRSDIKIGPVGDWYVDTNKLRCSSTAGSCLLFTGNFSAGIYRADMDISCEVSSTLASNNKAGMLGRAHDDHHLNVGCVLDGASMRVKCLEGVGSNLAGGATYLTGTTPLVSGQTYLLRMNIHGNTYDIYLDGNFEGTFAVATDPTWLSAGTYSHGNDTAARWNNFAVAKNTAPAATSYELRNWDGDILASGAISDDHLDIPDAILTQRSGRGPYGWYRIYLYGTDRADGQWRTAYGDGAFCRVRDDTNFPANFPNPYVSVLSESDEYARSVLALGPARIPLGTGSATPSVTYVNEKAGATVLKTSWADLAHASRPRVTIGAFHDGTSSSANVTATVNELKTVMRAFECRNEPDGTPAALFVTELHAFYDAVKAADPTALVLGPNPTVYNYALLQWIDDFLTAGGAAFLDGFTVHGYNCTNGSLSLARDMLVQLKAKLAAHGVSLPLWQTEQSFGWQYAGLVWPRRAARWQMIQIFVQELYGITVERNHLWYDKQHGFDSVPHWWLNATGPGPQALPVRTMVAEIGDRTLATSDGGVDFGTYGNTMYAAGIWNHASNGTKTIGVLGSCNGLNSLTINVTGTSTLTCSDSWGNTFTIAVTSGQASVPVMELPTWVRVPNGVTITFAPLGFTTNVATLATASTTSTATNISRINNGTVDNQYASNSADAADPRGPYFNETEIFPQTHTLTWAAPVVANRIVLYAFSPWQFYGSPTDFDIDTWDGSTWTTRYSHPLPASKTFAFTSGDARCTAETYWDDRWVFDVGFATAAISKVRVVIRAASWGEAESTVSWAAWNGWPGKQFVTISEVQVFGDVAPASQDRPAVRPMHRRFGG